MRFRESTSHQQAEGTQLSWRHAHCREDGTSFRRFVGPLTDKKLGLQGPFMTLLCIYMLCVTFHVPDCCAAVQSTLTGWKNGPTGVSWSSTKGNASFCTWEGVTLCSSTSRGLTTRKAALQKHWRSWWMSWFNASWQLSTTQPLTHSPHVRMEERIGRVKVRKLVG